MIRRHLRIYLFYVMLAALALNRLLLHIHEYVGIGDGSVSDYYHAHWNYWWIRKALTTPGLSVYHSNYVLFPFDSNLGFHTMAPFWFPVWALVEPLTNTFVAMNLIMWLGLSLTGYMTYLFLRDNGAAHIPALIGGALMAMLPHFTWAASMTLPVYVAGFWYPLPLLLWNRIARTQKLIWSIVLGLVFWLMLMTDFSSLMFVALVLGPYALWTLIKAGKNARLRLIGLGALPFVILLALAWIIAPLRPMLDFPRDLVSPADVDGTSLFSLPLSGLIRYSGSTDKAIGASITLLTLASLLRRSNDRERWLWFGLGITPILLAFGPDVAGIPMPYRVVHDLVGGMFRAPVRFAPVGVLMWLVFVARSWSPMPKINRLVVVVPLLLLILADLRVLQPFPAGPPVPEYQFYADIGADEEDYLVMNVPVSVGSGWIIHGNFPQAQFYALMHGKRTMNGLIARVPGDTYGFFVNDPTIGWLGGFRPLEPDVVRDELAGLAEVWTLGAIAVHQEALGPGQAEEIIGFLNSLDYLCPVTVEGEAVLYRTRPDCPPRRLPEIAPGSWQIDFGLPGDELFIGMGFYRKEIIGGPSARWLGSDDHAEIFIDLPPTSDYVITVEATAFQQEQQITLRANGSDLGEMVINPNGYQQNNLTLPTEILGDDGHLHLEIFYEDAVRGLSDDPRALSIALNWIRFDQE